MHKHRRSCCLPSFAIPTLFNITGKVSSKTHKMHDILFFLQLDTVIKVQNPFLSAASSIRYSTLHLVPTIFQMFLLPGVQNFR